MEAERYTQDTEYIKIISLSSLSVFLPDNANIRPKVRLILNPVRPGM